MFYRFVLILTVLALAGCCGLKPDAEQALLDAISINEGHINDDGLPQAAREIAQDNYDFDYGVLYRAGCIEKLPDDVRARKDARDAAKAAAEGGGGE